MVKNNRVGFGESAFGLIPAGVFLLLGFVFSILSLVFTSRTKKVAAVYQAKLQPEGIILFEEDFRGSMMFRNFRSPGNCANWRKAGIFALLALTQKRLFALKGSSPIIDVPLTDERLKEITLCSSLSRQICFSQIGRARISFQNHEGESIFAEIRRIDEITFNCCFEKPFLTLPNNFYT